MAWRIHEHVTHGRIDNRLRGHIKGRISLAGVEQPIELDLHGDCAPDIAGCDLSFENPKPIPMVTKPLASRQRGAAGEITAARKVRVFDVPIEDAMTMIRRGETPPEHMANGLYIEWYSEASGCVVVESASYRLQISEPAWRFTAEEITERERRIRQGDTPFAVAISNEGEIQQWDEARYEQFLRESDVLTEKYGRLLEKYADHPDRERIIAREMGWKWLDEALAQEQQVPINKTDKLDGVGDQLHELDEEIDEYELPPPDPIREGIDWVYDEKGGIAHPIKKRADDALHELLDELKATGHFPDSEDVDLGEFVGGYMTVTAKIAGALGGLARGEDFCEAGMVIAWLKRILEILHRPLAASDAIASKSFLPPPRLAYYRGELFAIREAILELIARLRAQID